jgi:hypothetical protein
VNVARVRLSLVVQYFLNRSISKPKYSKRLANKYFSFSSFFQFKKKEGHTSFSSILRKNIILEKTLALDP